MYKRHFVRVYVMFLEHHNALRNAEKSFTLL